MLRKFFLYLAIFLLILFSLLYIAVNSSYVFDKAARYFGPQYEIRYDKVSGNVFTGITVEGLYYKEMKLARQIKIKLNPATLLENKITVSHLTLHGVNEQYLEHMISDFSSDEEGNSSGSSFPLSVRLNDVKLTMLPFHISGIHFVQADLKVESVDYAGDGFSFGTLRLLAKTSLGRADVKGHYQGRDLRLSDLYIGNLNTTEIERLFLDDNSTKTEKDDNSTEESPSIFIPKKLYVQRFKATVLPRSYHGILLSLLTIDGKDLAVDLDQKKVAGALQLSLRTDVAKAEIGLLASTDQMQFQKITVTDINLSKVLMLLPAESHDSQPAEGKNTENNSTLSIPFVPNHILVDALQATMLPTTLPSPYQEIALSRLTLTGKQIDLHLDQQTVAGALLLSLYSNVAKVDVDLLASVDQLRFHKITVKDINLTKLLHTVTSASNSSRGTAVTKTKSHAKPAIKIPFVSDHLLLDTFEANLLPTVQGGIPITETQVKVLALKLDLSRMLAQQGKLSLDIETQIASLHHHGTIKDNQLDSQITVIPKDPLFSRYHLPLRKGAVKKLLIHAVTDKEQVLASMAFSAKALLDVPEGAFNLDIKPSRLHVKYLFDTVELSGDLQSAVRTPYGDNSRIDLAFSQQKVFTFKGDIQAGALSGIDPRIISLLKGLTVNVDGNLSHFVARIESSKLQGNITLKDFSKGKIHLESKGTLAVGELVKLPEALKRARASILLDAPVDTAKLFPLHAKAILHSNVLNMDANASYDGNMSLAASITVPPKSLLKTFDKNIHFAALSPMKIGATLQGERLKANLQAKKLKMAATYQLKSGATQGDINLAGTHLKISGISSKVLSVTVGSNAIQTLLKAVNSIYKVDLPDVSGSVAIKAEIRDLSAATLTLHSKEIRIGKGRKEATKLSNLSLQAKGDAKGVVLESYAVETEGVKLYASKPSKIELKGDRVLLSPLWVNDSLKATGEYNLKKKKGRIVANATALKISHDLADIITALGIDTTINGERVSVKGKIHLKGGNVKYDLNTKSFAADSDIIILQHQKKQSNYFQKNIAIQLTLDSSKPLLYKKGDIDIALLPKLRISKRYGGKLKLHGKVWLNKGGSYTFQGKRFVLQKSSITFKGKPTAPILNINIVYRHTGTTIRVKVSGTASDPSLNFSSDPHMSREEILSFIMFDTGRGGGENKAEDVTNLVAGSLVKSLFANMGLKLDHLVLTGAGFEVGKKLSDKITVIYDQQNESSVKLRIQNTKNIETDISFGADSRSADIFYKREF